MHQKLEVFLMMFDKLFWKRRWRCQHPCITLMHSRCSKWLKLITETFCTESTGRGQFAELAGIVL